VTKEAPKPRSHIATRVLASFAVTVLAFAVTAGWGVVAQRRAAADNVELVHGYVPVALRLAQLRASQSTLFALVQGIDDEGKNASTLIFVDALVRDRKSKLAETKSAVTQRLMPAGGDESRELARKMAAELDSIEQALDDDALIIDRLKTAYASGESGEVNRLVVDHLGPIEGTGDQRLHALAERLKESMDRLASASYARATRAVYFLVGLAVLTLVVGVLVSLHTRKLLRPLAQVTERAKSVARGDLTPRVVEEKEDEISQLAIGFERMVAAVAREQARSLSNERLAAIGKMAAHVTHEIRNPLSSIGLNMELLEEELTSGTSPEETRALLQAIKREVLRLEHLSEEYLRVARLPQPRMEAEDVAAAVREIASFARPEIERAGCTLEVRAEPAPPALFDESQLRQALLNLLRNARESMPKGGPITVTVAAEGMSVVIDIDDRGGGIPEDIRARVFDPFFSTKGEGTGLGLAITRHIVEAHGGSVACEVREGGGTRFRIALPIAPSRVSQLTAAQ
jgi:signal transduction histidine kinase